MQGGGGGGGVGYGEGSIPLQILSSSIVTGCVVL